MLKFTSSVCCLISATNLLSQNSIFAEAKSTNFAETTEEYDPILTISDKTQEEHTMFDNPEKTFRHPFLHEKPHISQIHYPLNGSFSLKLDRKVKHKEQ